MKDVEARLNKIENTVSLKKRALIIKINKGIFSENQLKMLRKQDDIEEVGDRIFITINY